MSRKSRLKSTVPQTKTPAKPAAGFVPAAKTWRWWAARLGLAIGIPIALLTGTEGLLRLFGFGYPTAFCIRSKDGSAYTDNSRFLWQFYSPKTILRPNPFSVPIRKAPGEVRVVVIGESAAAGAPDPAYSFGRILERMLRQQFPQGHVTVINAAMSGVNSHILLPAARDCLRLQPDLFVVYTGNNEAVGLYAPGSNSGRLTGHRRLLRLVQWLRAQRLGQLVEPLLTRISPRAAATAEGQDESFFQSHRLAADDPRRAAVYENFRANLVELCTMARPGGAGVVLATLPVNLKDCPPFGSMRRKELANAALAEWQRFYEAGAQFEATGQYSAAISNFLTAAKLDDHFADLEFRLARCQAAVGQTNEARQAYIKARDWDAIQFRTDSRMNGLIRQTAAQGGDGTLLVDAEAVFAEADPIPGEGLFRDHVHLNFDGAYLLARAVFPSAREILGRKLGPAASPPLLTRDQAAAALALTPVNEVQIETQIVRTTALPPFTGQFDHTQRQKAAEQRLAEHASNLGWQDFEKAAKQYQEAVAQAPGDARLRFQFARLLMLRPDLPGAIEQFGAARQLLPHWAQARIELAAALSRAGRVAEAIQELEAAEAMDGSLPEIEEGLKALRGSF